MAGDVPLVDFVRTVGDSQCASGGKYGGEGEVLRYTGPAVELDRSIDDLEGDPGSDDLDRRDLRTRTLGHHDGVSQNIIRSGATGGALKRRIWGVAIATGTWTRADSD